MTRGAENGTTRAVSSAKAAAVLNQRHREWHVDRKVLGAARRKGRKGRLRGKTVDELEAELAKRACREDDCERRAPGEPGYCVLHVRGASSRGRPRPRRVRRAISRTKRERPHIFTLEQRGKMRAAKGHGPAKLRYCKCGCGEPLLREGLELEGDVPLEVLEQYGLVDTQRDFLSCRCQIVWAWTHDRGRFPHGALPPALSCDVCGRDIERWWSQERNRKTGGYRFVCKVCDPIYRRYYHAAARVVDDAQPRAGR